MTVEPSDDAAITRVSGTGVAVRGDDVDTDQILPARFLKEVSFELMDEYAFYDQRRDDDGELNDHPLNERPGAEILVVNRNFGCGSSREHAPQALLRWGVDGIVGESFAEIFYDNCKSIGVPAVTADHDAVLALQRFVEEHPDETVTVDVENREVRYGDETVPVTVGRSMREAFVEGRWDTTALMRANAAAVEAVDDSLPGVHW